MEETYLLNHPGVTKKILHGGHGPLPHFPNGTKLVFHFQTLLDNFERTVIDDSRRNKQPTEIFVGKMFKMEVWEVLLTSMRIGEVAEFWCDATHTGLYAMVSKGMRLAAQGKDPLEGQRHTCGLGNMFHYHSTGFPELDELMRTPQPLIFIMELISVGDVFSYQRESWMMEKDEKLKAVPSLHFLGNALVKQGRYRDAADKYKEAILLLRTVQSREMPGDEDYIHLSRMIIPLVLNYCQCMLELEEYYEVIEHTTELLDKHKDCVKAYYKRAKAYAAVWSEKEARKDFQMVANLDVTLSKLVHRELGLLSERMKEKYYEDKERYWNILEAKEEKERREDDARDVKEEERSQSLQEFKAAEEEKSPSRVEDGPSRESGERTSSTEDKDWQQMLRLIMLLQDEGNFYVKEHRFAEATGKFTEALEYIDRLQTKVEHKGEDWDSLEKVGLPLRLNLSHCKLELGDFREVVDLNDKLLKSHKDHLKAVYQRARAHAALCNEDQARRDFNKVLQLDPTFKPIVTQEIRKLGEKLRQKSANDNQNYWTSTKEKWEKKAKSKRAKQSDKKGVTWADESEVSGGKVGSGESSQGRGEGQKGISDSGGSSRVSTGDKDEKQSSLDGKEESSVTLRGDHQEKDSVRSNMSADGMERTKVETDSKSEGNLLNIHNTEKKHDQDTTADQIQASPESSSPSSSGEKTLLRPTDVPGDEKTEGGGADVEVEMGKEEISTKSEKRSKKRKPKKK